MAAGLGDAAVSGVASKVAESAFDVIGRHISYVFKYQNHMDELKQQVEQDLKNKRQRVEVDVNSAERQGEEIYDDVKQWLTDVNKFTEEVANLIIGEEEKAKKHLCKGLCPNYIKRYKLGKKAVKAAKDGADLLGKGNFSRVSFRLARQRTSSMHVRGYEGFDSRESNLKDIIEALKDADSKIIGVWGMGGVGKTTLVKKVAGRVMEDKLFETVVMAEVTQTIDYKKIQEKIAYDLDLEFGLQSEFERAGRIRDRLKKEKRVLIILDNLWGQVDLEAVGIFAGDFEKGTAHHKQRGGEKDDNERRCKILLTSREKNVLLKDMKAQKYINVSPLSTEEALNWFWKIAGDSAKKSDFRPIAVKIVEKCAGLPLAITTIAASLEDKDLSAWNDALNQLSKCNLGTSDMGPVQSIIQLSYNWVKNDEAKQLFQLCGLFNSGYSIHIDELLSYGMGLKLFKNCDKLDEGRRRLNNLIHDLEASCLLLDGDVYQSFKMHDVIHSVAVSIARDELMFNLESVSYLKDKLEDGDYKDSTAISMPSTNISELPERLNCSKLKLFLLFAKDPNLEVPDAFFEGMEQLKVLDLSRINFRSQPSSLCQLTNLQTLRLSSCKLGDIGTVGELRKLEILSFWGSDIKLLPEEIVQLTRLKLLNLGNCSQLETIKPNIISSLSRLEELYLNNSFTKWEVEELNDQERRNASLVELNQLSRMTTLMMQIHDAKIMPQDLFSQQKLERFRILMGDVWSWSEKYESSRILKLKLTNNIHLRPGIKMLLKKAEDLSLDELAGVRDDVCELDGEGFPNLKYFHVQNGPELLYVANSMGKITPYNAFPVLESLFLDNLIRLDKICQGQLSKGSLSKLKLLEVCKCVSLRYIFTPPVVMGLGQLQKMTIKECDMLEEIIAKEGEKDSAARDKIIFRLLDAIILDNLRNLKVFYSESNILEFPSLKSITIHRCPKMETFVYNDVKELHLHPAPLFSDKVVLPALESLDLYDCSGFQCLFSSSIEGLPSLETLAICGMHDLRKLWPNKLKSFDKLEDLYVTYCQSLEEIVYCMEAEDVAKEEAAEAVPTFVFPHLIFLRLWDLPNLTNFYPRKHISKWPKLEELEVWDCEKVQILMGIQDRCRESQNAISIRQPLFSVDKLLANRSNNGVVGIKVGLPSLKKLEIWEMGNLRKIWQNEPGLEIPLGTLRKLDVKRCNKLVNIFSYDMIGGLQRLNALTVRYCKSLEEIVSCMEEETIAKGGVEEAAPTVVFPQLNSLSLKRLPCLTNFYPKKYISKWPMLKSLHVERCDKVEIFGSEFLILQYIHGESRHEILMQQPLFFVDTVPFPSLKELRLRGLIKSFLLWKKHSQPGEDFKNLGTVRVSHSDNLVMIEEIIADSKEDVSDEEDSEVEDSEEEDSEVEDSEEE